jgi:hypothetical protein
MVLAQSQPGRLRAGMQRVSRTPSVSGNGCAGAEGALDAAADRGWASCAEWAGAQWAAEHCMIGRPPRLWQVPGLGWAVLGQLRAYVCGVSTYWVGSIFAHHATCAIPEHAVRTFRVACAFQVRKRT